MRADGVKDLAGTVLEHLEVGGPSVGLHVFGIVHRLEDERAKIGEPELDLALAVRVLRKNTKVRKR